MRLPWITSLAIVPVMAQLALAAEPQSAARQAAAASGWSFFTIASGAVTLAAAVALVWVVRGFLSRRAAGPKNDPRHLLHELCQAHGLSRRAERLLKRAAAAMGTPHAGRFFLEPQLLLQVQRCEQLRGSKRALGLLYDRLFGEDTE
ncbi:MAG: hypothetical protein ACR2FY_07195 [Pirellulaceae bacterium]